ncbi:MAG: hypothetical protein Q4F11_00060 [Eubacteriales bacterium]|nr:hypothetical protein [Eubacteriales bacterium]
MNDLYTQDKMARNNSDFGGSGVGSGHYTPRDEFKENLSEIKLPLILLAFAVLCFSLLVILTYTEIDLYRNGTAIEANVGSNGSVAYFRAPSGNTYTVNIRWANSRKQNGTVTVYYKNTDYMHAQPITAWWIYLIAYTFFGSLIVLIIFWIYKLFHKTNHSLQSGSVPYGYRSKFDE